MEKAQILVNLDDLAHAMRIPEGTKLSLAAKIVPPADAGAEPVTVRCEVERKGDALVIHEPERPKPAAQPEQEAPAPPKPAQGRARNATPPPAPETKPATPEAKSGDEKPAETPADTKPAS